MEEKLAELERRIARFEKMDESCFQAHKGLSIVASEGLRGGGTIDNSRALALALGGLEKGTAPAGKSWFVFWDESEGQHFRIELEALVETLRRCCNLPDTEHQIERLNDITASLLMDFRQLGLYDTLPRRYDELSKREMEQEKLAEWIKDKEESVFEHMLQMSDMVNGRKKELDEREIVTANLNARAKEKLDIANTRLHELEESWKELLEEKKKLVQRELKIMGETEQLKRVQELEVAEADLERRSNAIEQEQARLAEERRKVSASEARCRDLELHLNNKLLKLRQLLA